MINPKRTIFYLFFFLSLSCSTYGCASAQGANTCKTTDTNKLANQKEHKELSFARHDNCILSSSRWSINVVSSANICCRRASIHEDANVMHDAHNNK